MHISAFTIPLAILVVFFAGEITCYEKGPGVVPSAYEYGEEEYGYEYWDYFFTLGPTSPTAPSGSPSRRPSKLPTTKKPSRFPTFRPTRKPSLKPSRRPSKFPTKKPTKRLPTMKPSKKQPSSSPSNSPGEFYCQPGCKVRY
jgi:hypothetical protein